MTRTVAEEAGLPPNWVPLDTAPINPSDKAGAPPLPNDMGGYFQGSLSPTMQHDAVFVGTQYGSPNVPSVSLMPVASSGVPSVQSAIQSGSQVTIINSSGSIAAGSNGQIQFNNGGSLGASSALTWDNVNDVVTINGSVVITGSIALTGSISAAVFNATTGFQVAGLAPVGQYLRGNGTDFISAVLSGSDVLAGLVGVTYGGTGSNLSATGGAHQVVQQSTLGGVFTVGQLAASDLSNGTTGTGAVVLANSPALTGSPTAPTQSPGDNSTKIATDAFVQAALPTSLPPNGPAGGDLSGTYPNPSVAQVNGAVVPASKTIVGTNGSSQLIDASSSTLANNTTGTAANLSGTPALPNGTTATTQAASDNSTKLATTAYADASANPGPSICFVREDFFSGSNTTGTIGALGWTMISIGSTPTVTPGPFAVSPQCGVLLLSTAAGATQGQGGSLILNGEANASGIACSDLVGSTGWEFQWIFKLSQTTNIRFRAGFDSFPSFLTGNNGLHIRFDTNASFGDTNFIFESCTGATATKVDSGIAVDTNWHRVKITSLVAGTATFILYDNAGNVLSTKTLAISFSDTTFGVSPWACIGTDTSAQRSVNLDYASMYIPGLAR